MTKTPGPEHFSRAEVDDLRPCAKIHLSHIAGGVVEHDRGRPFLHKRLTAS